MIVPIMELIYCLLCRVLMTIPMNKEGRLWKKLCEVMVIVFHIDMNELIILMRLFKDE